MPRSSQPAQSPPQPRRSAFTLIEMVVVVGIIGTLMALGVPGIVSSIKRADLSATTNIIGTLHTFCYNAARSQTGLATKFYTMEISPATVTVKFDGTTLDAWEIGKQFNYDNAKTVITLVDAFAPSTTTIITYGARTGFVKNTLPNSVVVFVKDKLTGHNKFELTFWATGVLNVKSAP